MLPFNWISLPVAALVPFIIGAIWYHPKVLGTKWMKLNGFSQEDIQGANMIKIFGLSFIFNSMLAVGLISLVIHQMHVLAIMSGDPNFGQETAESTIFLQGFMAEHGNDFRSFGHGALHGVLGALFIIFPTMCVNNLFERRKFGLSLIHSGYWIITMALMGGIICVWKP